MTKKSDGMLHDLHYTIAKQPLIPQEEITGIFEERQALLERGIDLLLRFTNYVEFDLMRLSSRIAASTTHGRCFYTYTARRYSQTPKDIDGFDEEEWSLWIDEQKQLSNPDVKAFYHDLDIDLLAFTSILAKRVVHGRQTTLSEIKQLHLLPIILEETLYRFLGETKLYKATCLELTRLRMGLDLNGEVDGNLLERITALDARTQSIEQLVSGDCWSLFGVIRQIESIEKHIREIRDRVHNAYLRLCLKVARRHAHTATQVEDHFQNASAGMLRAISTYEVSSGAPFSSYATHWVKQAVLYELKNQSNIIRLPITLLQENTQIEGARAKIEAEHGGATDEDIADNLGRTVKRIQTVTGHVSDAQVLSLDHPARDGGDDGNDTAILNAIQDDSISESVAAASKVREAQRLLRLLMPEDALLVRMHYGLLDSIPQTISITEIEIQRERLRQQVAAILLRQSASCKEDRE